MKWNVSANCLVIGLLWGVFCLCSVAAEGDSASAGTPNPNSSVEKEDTIILLQGMGRGRASLWVLDTRLRQDGYRTLSFPYSASRNSIDVLGEQLCAFISENIDTGHYHLIAHSLGNVILRAAFRFGYPSGLGRIVMLAPPNEPADLARALRDNQIYQWFTGTSGQQLASEAFYEQLPVPEVEFGIIAGERGQSFMLKEPNDGVITVENTKLAGMTDWISVHQSHNFIMNSRVVAALCISFIEDGAFDRQLLSEDWGRRMLDGENDGGPQEDGKE